MKIKGKVKSLVETQYTYNDDSGLNKNSSNGTKFFFNEFGNKTHVYSMENEEDVKLKLDSENQYNDSGKILMRKIYTTRGLWIWESFEYENNKLTKETRKRVLTNDTLVFTEKYKYKNGEISEIIRLDEEGEVTRTMKCYYDDKMRATVRKCFSPKGKLIFRDYKRYDSKGNVSEVKRHDEDKKSYWHTKYEYNDKTLIKAIGINSMNKSKTIKRFEYQDSDKLMSYEWTYIDKEGRRLTVEHYNVNGDVVEKISNEGGENRVTKYKYEYTGANWTVCSKSENGKIFKKITREIEYF